MKIIAYENKNEIFLEVNGHAHADKDGFQYPCSKISILTQTLAATIMNTVGAEYPKNVDYESYKGYFRMKILKNGISDEATLYAGVLYNSCIVGLSIVYDMYPGSFEMDLSGYNSSVF